MLSCTLVPLIALTYAIGLVTALPLAKTIDRGLAPRRSGVWQPAVGTTWQIELANALTDTTEDFAVFDIDLFDNSASTISALQAKGKKVICYFSAGSYENWRPDVNGFQPSDLGKALDGWPGERWVDTKCPNIRNIMAARLDLAVRKGCDGVDPDNVDAYDNDNGLGLTQADAVTYVQYLAGAAHSRGLAIGLKNAGAIIPQVIDQMQWAINEQCVEYGECHATRAFIDAGKPVFHIEYPHAAPKIKASTKATICDNASARGFSTLLKDVKLDNWYEACPTY